MLPPSQSIFSEELQKMKETNNSESSNYPQALRALSKSLSCTLTQTREASSCYYNFPRLPACIYPGARTRFSGNYQLNPEYGTAAVPASGGFLLHKYEKSESCIPVMPLSFEILQQKKYFPPSLLPRWLLRKSFCF